MCGKCVIHHGLVPLLLLSSSSISGLFQPNNAMRIENYQ